MKKFILALPVGLLSLLATALIAYLSLASDPFSVNEMHVFKGFDKVAHLIMYFGLTAVYLADYAKFRLPHHTSTNIELALASVAIVVGLMMEVAQLVDPDHMRTFELLDWGADIVGAGIGFLVMKFYLLHKWRKWLYRASIHRRHHKRHPHLENDSDM